MCLAAAALVAYAIWSYTSHWRPPELQPGQEGWSVRKHERFPGVWSYDDTPPLIDEQGNRIRQD